MGHDDRRVAGVDGCPGGWLAALVGDGVEWLLLPDASAVVALDAPAIGVDVPIGLSRAEPRSCDRLARAALGPRRSCVFPAPPRDVLGAADYRTACDRHRAVRGVGMSKQAYFVCDRIADFDAVMTPTLQRRVFEVHPELSFAALAGAPLESKRHAAARDRRRALLAAVLPGVGEAMRRVPRPATDADALDALACAWTARRVLAGDAVRLPPEPAYDERGLRMEIAG